MYSEGLIKKQITIMRTIHFPFGKTISKLASALSIVLMFGLLPASASMAAALVNHTVGNPAIGASYWITAKVSGGGGCGSASCHLAAAPSDASFSAATALNVNFALCNTAGNAACPNHPLSYYANVPAAMTAAMTVVGGAGTGDMSALTNEPNAVNNQNDLSAYFASLFTPAITHNQATTVSSGAAYNGSILPVTGQDYLVTTTTYGITPAGSGMLVAAATGIISGTAPVVTTPTTYSITLSATNSGAIYPTATPTGTVLLSLKVLGKQTISFGTLPTMTFGGATGTLTATGGTSGNAVTFTSQTTGVCTVSGTNGATLTAVAAGTCTIAANQAGTAGSYDAAAQVTQNITVSPASQTIAFGTLPTMTFGGATGALLATGGGSGNAVTFTSQTTGVCTVSGTNGATLTAVTAGTCIIAANQTGNTNYSAATQVTQNIAVNLASQVISFGTLPTMTYGGGTGTVLATGGGSGNAVTFTSQTTGVCTVSGTNGATLTAVTAGTCTIAANQLGNANYNAATQTLQNITVSPATQTISFGVAPNVLVGATGTVSATGGASGNAVTFTSQTTGVCTVSGTNGSTVTGVTAGTCIIAANQLGNTNYSAAVQTTQNIAIGLNPQTITFGTAPTMTFGGGAATVSATGGASGNAVTFSVPVTTTICSVAGNTVTALAAGTCTVQANQAGNASYAAATQTQNINIGKASQTLSFVTVPTVVVGGTGTISATGGASGSAVTFSSQTAAVCTVSGTNGSTVTGVTTGTCMIAANQAGNGNYNAATQVTQSFSVGKGSQTIAFGAAPAILYGGSGSVTATATSGGPITYSSLTSSVCSISGNVVSALNAGTCTIAASQAGDTNYNPATQATQSFSIGQVGQTISFGAAPTLAAGGTGSVSATGGASGSTVTFSSLTTGICSVSGTTVRGLAIGTCTIAANQAGTANYGAAAQVTQNIAVGQGSQTITFGAAPSLAVGGTATVSVTGGGSTSPLVLTSTTLTICTVSGTTVTGVSTGNCTIAANQAADANYAAASQVTQSIAVVNLPPNVAAASMSTPLNTAVTLDLAPHITGFGITGVSISAQAAHGTVGVSGTKVTFTPHKDYFGADTFSYKAYAAGGLVSTSAATVSVTISGRPDPLKDARVTGLVNIQTAAVKRFGMAQVFNFQQRLESRHHAVYAPLPIGSPGESNSSPAPVGGALPQQGSNYFNSWQSGTALSYANNPNTLLHAASGNGSNAPTTPLFGTMMSMVTSALTSSTLNLGTLSNAVGAASADDSFSRLELWAAGNLRFGTRSQSGVDTQFTTDGISVGVDKRLDRKLTLGMGMGYARDKSSIGTDGTNSTSSGNSVAGYASYQMDTGAFLDGLLGYGKVNFDTNRYVAAVNDFARASRTGDQIFGSMSFGYEFRKEALLWSPYGRYDFSYDRLNQGTESGAGANALTYASQNMRTSHLSLGMRAQSAHQASFGVVQPHVRVEYQRGLETSGQTSVAYADLPGVLYAVAGTSQNTNAVVLGLGSDFLLSDTLKMALDYQRLRSGGFENYQSINFRLTKDINGKNDLADLLAESYESSLEYPSGLMVAAGFAYDDNVSRASAALDKLSDTIYSLTMNKGKSIPLTKHSRLTVSGFLDIEKFRTYSGLGHVSGGMQGEYMYRDSGEFGSPTFGIFARYTADEYESALRDGSHYSAGVTLRKPLTDRVNLFAAVANNVRTGKSDVFNTHDISGRMNLDYALATGKTLYLTGEYRKGDIVSSGRPSLAILDVSTVFVRDDVFNAEGFFSYRMKGQTALMTIGYNHSFGTKDSVDFAWRHVEATPDMTPAYASPMRYIDNLLSINYLMAF